MVIADSSGRRIMINQAGRGLLGDLAEPDAAFPYQGVTAFLYPDGTPYARHELPLDVALHEGQPLHEVEVIAQRQDGQRRTLLINVAPLIDASGAIGGTVGVFRDITTFKEAEQLKDDFLSLVSHELRTPLTTIHGGARTLLRHFRQLEPATVEDLLGDIVNESERLARLVSNMLDLSRIRAGRLQLQTEPFLLAPVIRRSVEAMRPKLAGLQVTLAPSLDAPPVEGDAERIEQVLRNLLENAGKYVPPGGRVTISVRVEPPVVVTTVADDGPGIPTDQLERIFERFHRIEGHGQTSSGVGLGLYLSRHMVEANGGTLWVESAPGRGSAFSFSLPLADSVGEND
jgi:signal transduction histidine kinase